MADDRPPTDGPSDDKLGEEARPDLKRPKRTPPTLDLSATEIPRAANPDDPVPPIDEPVSEPAAEPAPDDAPRAKKPSTIVIPALAGAAAASFIMILISLAGWPVGAPTTEVTVPAPTNTAALDELTARLARLEARPVAPPAPAPAPAGPSLAPRIDALDKTVAALRDDVAATRTRSEAALAGVSELKAAPPPVAPPAPPPDLSAITSRLTQIESAIKTQADAAAKQAAKPADDAPLRRVVAASLLDMQVRQGQPYVAALQAASLGADPARVKPLQSFAATGLPSAEMLSKDLLALLPKLTPPPAAPETTGSGIMDRLQQGAMKLVKIERSDAASDTGKAVVTRAADAARRNDLAAARRDLASLSPADRAIVQPWIDRVDARDAAIAASQQFATDAMTALAKPLP